MVVIAIILLIRQILLVSIMCDFVLYTLNDHTVPNSGCGGGGGVKRNMLHSRSCGKNVMK